MGFSKLAVRFETPFTLYHGCHWVLFENKHKILIRTEISRLIENEGGIYTVLVLEHRCVHGRPGQKKSIKAEAMMP